MSDEFDTPPSGEAQALLDSELLSQILAELESDAMEKGVNANPSDDETRRVGMTMVRAIRDLKSQLESLAKGRAKRSSKPPVA